MRKVEGIRTTVLCSHLKSDPSIHTKMARTLLRMRYTVPIKDCLRDGYTSGALW
jgi:hypothetical protein